MEPKTGIFRDREGRVSLMRNLIVWYFWFVAAPGSIIAIVGTMAYFISSDFKWEQVAWSLGVLVVLNINWIAAKLISKVTENDGMVERMKVKEGRCE